MVDLLEAKFLDRRSNLPGHAPQVFQVSDGNNLASNNCALNVNGKSDKKPYDPKTRPCFNYQKNQSCDYGSKCKYSHDDKICEQINLATTEVEDQCVYNM